MTRELVLIKMLVAMLCVVLLVLLVVWVYRYVQYRRAVRLSQMRWLHFEATKAFGEAESNKSLDWPPPSAMMLNPPAHLLSPIPEERGRESVESLGSARRANAASFVSYGSVELP